MVNNVVTIEKQIRQDTPQVSVAPYKQIHAHSTGNPGSTAKNEADYMNRKDLSSGFYTHVVGNGRIIQTARTNRGAWDVGGSWNNKTYAAVELIESHKIQEEFDRDYKIYVQLLRDLAIEAGIPIQVDCGVEGINTHYYCTYNQPGNKSDHIDPYPYLQKWGISKAQFKKDVENGFEVNGWQNQNNHWQWLENGVKVKNQWKSIGGRWYYFNGVGDMSTGWLKKDNKWYYLSSSGDMKVGWQIIGGRYYKLKADGSMAEGWYKEGNAWYYLEASGAMKTGWLKDQGGNWYYLSKPNGAMVTGTVPIDGKVYTFNASGICQNP